LSISDPKENSVENSLLACGTVQISGNVRAIKIKICSQYNWNHIIIKALFVAEKRFGISIKRPLTQVR